MKFLFNKLEIQGQFCELTGFYKDFSSLHQLSESLGRAVDAKDSVTYKHSEYVAIISHLIALAMGFSAKQADIIHLAGHLHDIGKIGIPDEVLKKRGKFTNADWQWMRKHPEIGAKIITPVKPFRSKGGLIEILLQHHERFDGSGYPMGLQGKEIHIGARIIAVADALSALIQDRPYRRGRDFFEAVEEIERNSGTQFDPLVVKVFLEIQSDIKQWLEGL